MILSENMMKVTGFPLMNLLVAFGVLLVPGASPVSTGPAGATLQPGTGMEHVGRPMPGLGFDRRIEVRKAGSTPKAVLYRWWTDTCPYCEATLPALEMLRKEYESRGLSVVAVYHPKPPRPVSDRQIREAAKAIGYTGDLAVDADWSELHKVAGTRFRHATSISVLVDANGIIRHFHPGPVFFPSADPEHASENGDFLRLRQAIEVLLKHTPSR